MKTIRCAFCGELREHSPGDLSFTWRDYYTFDGNPIPKNLDDVRWICQKCIVKTLLEVKLTQPGFAIEKGGE